MSHDEERAIGYRFQSERDRAPRHWLNLLVGFFCLLLPSIDRRSIQCHLADSESACERLPQEHASLRCPDSKVLPAPDLKAGQWVSFAPRDTAKRVQR